MLSASCNNVTGQLSYSVNGVRGAGRLISQSGDLGMPFRDYNSKSADFYFRCRILSAISGVKWIRGGGRLGGCGMSKSNVVRSSQMLTCNRTSEPGDRDAAAGNDNDVSARDAQEVA
jgi:hypothetical protein